MTGFGLGEASTAEGRVVVEARSVNHRFLEVKVRAARELSPEATRVEQLVRRRLARGHAEVTLRFERAGGVVLDRVRARSALEALSALAAELGLDERPPLTVLTAVPELFSPTLDVDRERLAEGVDRACASCLDELERSRRDEGAQLRADLEDRASSIASLIEALVESSARAERGYRARVKQRVQRLLDAVSVPVDPSRMEHELAILAAHADVSEELTRLAAHAGHLRALLARDEPVGRKLDFLLQELHREANTLGAKSVDVETTVLVVELKAELERSREQAQNVE